MIGSKIVRLLGAAAWALLVSILGVTASQADQSTWERVMETKTLRVSAIDGEAPYYIRDKATGEWTGGIWIDMAKDIAEDLGVKLQIVETASWGSAILDLRSGKTDIHFGVNPTPQRGMVLDFSDPVYINTFNTICRPGVDAKTWDDLNQPDVRIAVDIGSSSEHIADRYASKAAITRYKIRDEVILAMASGKADCFIETPLLSLSTLKKNPGLGTLVVPTPTVYTVSPIVVAKQPDDRMIEFVNVWISYQRGLGQIRDWIINDLAKIGVKREDIPAAVQF
jgi:polar amino acid transport system substrate-binding protein